MSRKFDSLEHMLSNEIVEDMAPEDVYIFVKKTLRKQLEDFSVSELCDEYGEKYDYVFLEYGVDPI